MEKLSPVVGIIMGSDSDYSTMAEAGAICMEFDIPYEIRVASAHRTPDDTAEYARTAADRGIKVIIAGAGGAAHLPGVIAAYTTLPVIGIPIQSKALNGMDSLLSIVQMPPGVPVATVAIGGGKNAGILAMEILGVADPEVHAKLINYKKKIAQESRDKNKHEHFGIF
ncbi:MAG: 5-(carboxyamino)imidazole ribonucleotide mutase [Candidatus Kapabacteria bacterium]|nr:5-(carboxyamino)imidazole ribonucleotide mutase [Candidatus Kapabacteria bacterium]